MAKKIVFLFDKCPNQTLLLVGIDGYPCSSFSVTSKDNAIKVFLDNMGKRPEDVNIINVGDIKSGKLKIISSDIPSVPAVIHIFETNAKQFKCAAVFGGHVHEDIDRHEAACNIFRRIPCLMEEEPGKFTFILHRIDGTFFKFTPRFLEKPETYLQRPLIRVIRLQNSSKKGLDLIAIGPTGFSLLTDDETMKNTVRNVAFNENRDLAEYRVIYQENNKNDQDITEMF